MIWLTEDETVNKEFLAYLTEFLISEEVMHLFTIEEETTILNSIRTQVVQSGLVYTKETAWEFFVKNIRENTRIVIVMNENARKFQELGYETPSLFNNMELIWIQHWNIKQLVDNSLYHLKDIKWLDKSTKENLAHLLGSMHNSIRQNDATASAHLNNLTFTKFVEKFKEFLVKKYRDIESSHKNVCRLLEHIQRQHSTAKKLLVQLKQEDMVLEERMNSTNKMLQQIGQDMTMTEQQLKVHNMQTKKTVQLKRILPEFQSAHERNVYKTVAIVSNTKKLIQNINMNSLQELRSVQKPDSKVEDILAAIIMILKSPTADVTWQKGAKRQMANLDRFLEELQTFDEREITENTIKLLEDLVRRIDAYDTKEDTTSNSSAYIEALNSLEQWIKGVLKYHTLMIKHVKPLHTKVEEIEKEVKEADQKLTTLNRKSDALNARLKDLAQNFEEATVDKKEQEEKCVKMKQQLQTASDLNTILAREFDRNMQVYESLQERIFCLPGACALTAGFLVYLGPYQFPFRRIMLTNHWIKCLADRGLPLVLDSLNLIKGRIVKWQMDSLSHLLVYANEVSIPGEDWKVHFASEENLNDTFIVPTNSDTEEEINQKVAQPPALQPQPPHANTGTEAELPVIEENSESKLQSKASSSEKTVKIAEPEKEKNEKAYETSAEIIEKQNDTLESAGVQDQSNLKNAMFTEESTIKIESHAMSALSHLSEQSEMNDYFVTATSYRQFIIALIQYVIGENECMDWMSLDATGLELENGAIIANSEKFPPMLYDPFSSGTNWIISKLTNLIVDLETKNSEDLLIIEKSFQNGTKLLFSNCNEIDSALLPLIYYKNSLTNTHISSNSKPILAADESRLIIFSNRRLFCNPNFEIYFETLNPFDSFSPNLLTCTTPISFNPSVENFIDQFQLNLFQILFPEEYAKRNLLLKHIKECNKKLVQIDDITKTKWEKHGFQVDNILHTKLALQRKYKIGQVLEYCQEYLMIINETMKILTPLAIRASLLMTLSLKMTSISKNYEFSINLIEFIFTNMTNLCKDVKTQELKFKTQLIKEDIALDNSSGLVNTIEKDSIESELPPVENIDEINKQNTIKIYTQEDIETLSKYLTNSFLNSIIQSLLPEHRLYLLTLICFYIKSEQKSDFTDLELEFLMRGKYNSNINISLTDFGVPKNTPIPKWIPPDKWNDLLAMSLLQGELDHFVVAIVSSEKEWKDWYKNPFSVQMPKIEMEIEKTLKTEMVELNDFRKLILHKVLRPDSYITFLNDYVCQTLELKVNEPNWQTVFENPLFKSIVINMGSQSNISNTSSMSRIHKNLFYIAQKNNHRITALNCNFLTLTELRVEIKSVQDGFVLLKNAHLASKDVTEFIKSLCDMVNVDEQQSSVKWRLIITKSFDYILPLSVSKQSLQVSFDVIDIIAHNSAENNKKISLDTCLIKPETLIFNCIQSALNLTKNDSISKIVSSISETKKSLVFTVCLVQGLLQSRQNLCCNTAHKWLPWSSSSLIDCLISINQYDSPDFKDLPRFLNKNVYSNYVDDQLDKDYLLSIFDLLISNNSKSEIKINTVVIPIPESSVPLNEYANWFENKIPERKIELKVLQIHEQALMYYSTIRAEDFIENLQNLWETSSNNQIKLNDDLEQDWLYFSIKMCYEQLPSKLPILNEKIVDLKSDNSIAFSFCQEYKIFNETMDMVRYHLKMIEKYLLLNTKLFPSEFKNIALSIQSQRVPIEWEHPSCRPSIHSLKSWIKSQNVIYNQLHEIWSKKFKNIKSVKANILKQPKLLFSSILMQKCIKTKLNLNEVELCFEVAKDSDIVNNEKDGIVLMDLKVVNGCWDPIQGKIKKSELLVNKLPPLLVYASKIEQTEPKEKSTKQEKLRAYMNFFRQSYIISINLPFDCDNEVFPFVIFDMADLENFSTRLIKPVMPNVIGGESSHLSAEQTSNQMTNNSQDVFSSISAAGLSIRQSLSRSNQTLKQIREASAEATEKVTTESQLSYKPITPNAPALPTNLALTRSKPIEPINEKRETF